MYPDRPDPIGPAGASYRTTRKAVVGAIFCAAILSALTPRAAGPRREPIANPTSGERRSRAPLTA